MTMTDGEREIVGEIEADARAAGEADVEDWMWEDDYVPDHGTCRCGQPATGWGPFDATCDACFQADMAEWRRQHAPRTGPTLVTDGDDLADVPF